MTNIQILILVLVVILVIIYFTSNTEHFANEKGKGPCTTGCSNLNTTAPNFKKDCDFFHGKYEKCKTTKADLAKTGRKCVGHYAKPQNKCSNLR